MDLSIHTYGHIDSMFYVLNAIAMLMNHKFGDAIMAAIAITSTGYYAMRIAYSGSSDYQTHVGKVVAMIAMMSLLLVPRADMLIIDHVAKKKEKVDNLPLGFALPVGILENFGDLLTGGFEQAFTQVGNANYRDYGMIFGARLVQESRNWRIRSPEFMENMSNFIDRCVMVEAMIGNNYSLEDLLTTDDIWKLVSTNLGNLRQTQMRVGKTKELMSCKRAAKDVIEPAFRLEIEQLNKKYENTEIAQAGNTSFVQRTLSRMNANQIFKKNIELSFKSYLGINQSAENLIKQQMLINSLKNYSDEYGYVRSSATQESSWRIAGDLASEYLPILMTVLKCLVYSSFIFLFPMLLMSGGWGRYLGYLTLVASFQLWSPLNAVLNMFIDLYTSSTLSGIADHIVSFSSMSRVGNYTDKIVAVASGLQMSIPYLAFSIMQGGVSSLSHLAGTITGAGSSSASQAANESVTGNKSFDNYSSGNQQLYHQGGFKTDWNESYASGGSSYQHIDGSMERVTAGGNTLLQSGVGLTASSGATSYRLDDSRQMQASEGMQQAESLHSQDLRSVSNAKSNTFARAADYVAHIAQREHSGESFNYDSMGEQGKALQQAVNYTRQFHDKKGYGWNQAASAGMETSLSLSSPKVLGIGGSVGVNGSVTASNSSDQSVGKDTIINRDNHATESYSNVIRAASNSSWAKENSIDTGYSDSVRSSYEEQQRVERQASISQQRVEDWHKAKTMIDSQGGSSSKDMYQEVVDGIKQEYGTDVYTAQKMADRKSPEAQNVWKKLQNEDHYVQNAVENIKHNKGAISGSNAKQKLDDFTNEHDKQLESRPHLEQEISSKQIKSELQGKRHNLEQEHKKLTIENATQHHAIKKHNEMEEASLNKQTDKYEEDRIGKGLIASNVSNALGKITGGKAGYTVGKSDDNRTEDLKEVEKK